MVIFHGYVKLRGYRRVSDTYMHTVCVYIYTHIYEIIQVYMIFLNELSGLIHRADWRIQA